MEITPSSEGLIGIGVSYERYHLGILDSFQLSVDYVYQTVAGISQLFVPERTMEVLDNSTSVVGISVMSAQAASLGAECLPVVRRAHLALARLHEPAPHPSARWWKASYRDRFRPLPAGRFPPGFKQRFPLPASRCSASCSSTCCAVISCACCKGGIPWHLRFRVKPRDRL